VTRIVLGFVTGWVIGAAIPLYLGAADLLVRIAAATAIAGAVTGLVAARGSALTTVLTGMITSAAIWWWLKHQNHDEGPYELVGAAVGLLLAFVVRLPRRMTSASGTARSLDAA
jgi:hypothetical protein